jgi:hypothetical protein
MTCDGFFDVAAAGDVAGLSGVGPVGWAANDPEGD